MNKKIKTAPTSPEALLAEIARQFDALSPQLRKVARHLERHHDHLALAGVRDIALACNIQPSAVVRFAKFFGFSGFSSMHRLFRDRLSKRVARDLDYQQRIHTAIDTRQRQISEFSIAREVIQGSMASLESLLNKTQEKSFQQAVALLEDASVLWIAGCRRSYPVAAYLTYTLHHTGKIVNWLDGVGFMQLEQLHGVRAGDVLVVISFEPYARESQEITSKARKLGAKILAVSDGTFNPIAKEATTTLVVQDSAVFGFRSLASTMTLMQALFIALSYRMQLDIEAGTVVTRGRPTTTREAISSKTKINKRGKK